MKVTVKNLVNLKAGMRSGDITFVGTITTDQGGKIYLGRRQFLVKSYTHPDYSDEYEDAVVVLDPEDLISHWDYGCRQAGREWELPEAD